MTSMNRTPPIIEDLRQSCLALECKDRQTHLIMKSRKHLTGTWWHVESLQSTATDILTISLCQDVGCPFLSGQNQRVYGSNYLGKNLSWQ